MSRLEKLFIPTPDGPLAGVAHLPRLVPAPVVLCCHGMLSTKDSSKFTSIGELFSKEGFAVVRFDFSGCGESGAGLGTSLIGSRLRDLLAAIDFVSARPWASGELGLLGSSLGGFIALLGAASCGRNIKAVACWATPFDLRNIRLSLEDSDALRNRFPSGYQLGEPESLRSLPPIPGVMLIHGQQDEIVHWRDAEAIYRQVGEPKRLLLMESADHRILDPFCREIAMRSSLEWFREQSLLNMPG